MEKVFVKDLIADTFIDSPYLLHSLEVRKKKNGEDFLHLTLRDKTGDCAAVMWDNVAETTDDVKEGDFVIVNGKVSLYQDRPQITVQRMRRLSPEQVDEEDFIPASSRSRSEMWSELMETVHGIGHMHLRRLLLDIFEDEATGSKFRRAPAAKGNHHTYLGGLLEHTLSIVGLCEKIAGHYPEMIDRDLLVTGGLLHDLEKINELSYERSYDYTDEGRLVGHIVMGAADLDRRMREQQFPDKLRIKVLHLIISHHGELEYGSPKVPMTPEALALHYIDMIDSRMEMFRGAMAEAPEGEDGGFSPWIRGLGRALYLG